MSTYVPEAVIRRLPSYYRHLRDLEQEGVQQISSQELGERMGMTPSQIRQDINSFGGAGRQGYGYQVSTLKEHLRGIMGLDREHRMAIIGAGRIGKAVANYTGFPREGFRTVALFDAEPTGSELVTDGATIPVYPAEELEARLPELGASIGVLALPAGAAQDTADRLYRLGIRAIWNFTPADLRCPEDMAVMNVRLSESLHLLSYMMNQMGK